MMEPSDRPDFAKAMSRLFSNYGVEVTNDLLDSWWGALSGHDLRVILWAMNRHVTDPQWGHRRPTISDVVRHATETLPAERARIRAEKIRQFRARVEPLEEKLYQLEADVRTGLRLQDDANAELNGLRMQIGALYRESGVRDLVEENTLRLSKPRREPDPA